MDEMLKNLSTVCISIINDPTVHIDSLMILIKNLSTSDAKQILMLSITKVFKNIIPLYSIKVGTNKVKFGDEIQEATNYEKKLLECYRKFIGFVLNFDDFCSYKIACLLLDSLDHFNCTEKLIVKVLRGSMDKNMEQMCVDVIKSKIGNKQLCPKIVREMINCKFNEKILEYLIDLDVGDDKNLKNDLLRIYFTVLTGKKTKFYEFTYKGLENHFNLVDEKYFDGLQIMLIDSLSENFRIDCVSCYLTYFSERGVDLKNIFNVLFDLIVPLKYELCSVKLTKVIKKILIVNRQPLNRARAFVQRLIQYSLFNYSNELNCLIEEILKLYKIDVMDIHVVGSAKHSFFSDDVDFTGEKPFFEYSIFTEMKDF